MPTRNDGFQRNALDGKTETPLLEFRPSAPARTVPVTCTVKIQAMLL
jgi:hypothetical protein